MTSRPPKQDLSAGLYPANFDDSSFTLLSKNEFNRLSEDLCYKKTREQDNNKRLKFYTTNHADLANAQSERNNFFGIDIEQNLFVPNPENIDKLSGLRNGTLAGTMTNCRLRNEFGQLPLQMPFKGQVSRGDVCKEDSLRNYVEPKKNACLPKDTEYYKRHFSIFDDTLKIETPNALKSVERPELGFQLGRVGAPSRFDSKFVSKRKGFKLL
jgi:hypothetical protein